MLGKDEKCIQNLVGKTEGRTILGRPKRRWKLISRWKAEHVLGS
jgi:hypothetical protein